MGALNTSGVRKSWISLGLMIGIAVVVALASASVRPAYAQRDACAELRRLIDENQRNANNIASVGTTPETRASGQAQAGTYIAARNRAQTAYNQLGCGSGGSSGNTVSNSVTTDVDRAIAGVQVLGAIGSMIFGGNGGGNDDAAREEEYRRQQEYVRQQEYERQRAVEAAQRAAEQRAAEERARLADANMRNAMPNSFQVASANTGANPFSPRVADAANPFGAAGAGVTPASGASDDFVPAGGNRQVPRSIAADLEARNVPACPRLSEARNYCAVQPPWWSTVNTVSTTPYTQENCAQRVVSNVFASEACTTRQAFDRRDFRRQMSAYDMAIADAAEEARNDPRCQTNPPALNCPRD